MDSDLTCHKHVTSVCKTSYYHIRNLRRLRKHLSLPISTTIANAQVCSKLDYCNSLLYGISAHDMGWLQRVQNCLSRVVTKSPRFTSSLSLLHTLHWLPIYYRIKFKLALLTYKTLNFKEPIYLHNLLTYCSSSKNLRSESRQLLVLPRSRSKLGSRAFSVSAPSLWNSLPIEIRLSNSVYSFRKKLKTYFFPLAFPS